MATFIVQEVFIRDSETTGPQRNVQYDIILSYDEVKVKVIKSLDDIRKFFAEVVSTNKFGPLSLLTTTFEHSTPPAEVIVRDLCDILLAVSDNVWFHLDVINFFDGPPEGTKLTKLHMIHLTKQMQSMMSINAQMDRRISALEEKFFESLKINNGSSGWGQSILAVPPLSADSPITKDYQASPQITLQSHSGGDASGRDLTQQSSGELIPTLKGPFALRSDASFHSSDESDGHSISNDSDVELPIDSDAILAFDSQLQRQARTASFDSKGPISNRGNEEIAQSLLMFEETTGSFYDDVNALLKLIMPTEAQFTTKSSIFSLIRSQSRLAVNCSVFEFGLHEIGCNLPDDKLEISLLLSKNHFPTWHTSLCERLLAVAEGTVDSWVDADVSGAPNNVLGGAGVVPQPTHKVTDVRYTTDDSAYYVMCNVDSNWSVEISSNRRQELCMLAFYEEVANLVGKDYLFKRSLLLIRAWWSYETVTYVERDIRHYLPQNALCLMVCMIFNKFHWRIESPLQALALFLAEFLQYDNKKHVITLQGLVPFNAHSHSGQGSSIVGGNSQRMPLQLIPPQQRHLLTFEVLEKYWQLFNIGSSAASSNETPAISKSQFNPYNTTGYIAFDKAGFNILHPFTHTSLITEKVSSRRLSLIQKALQSGATKMTESIQKCIDANSTTSFTSTFFNKVTSKFGNNNIVLSGQVNRPQGLLYESNIFHYAIEKIWQNVLHCNFVLESVITESAILTASMENLSVKGPSPVGEVGKMLTEVSCMPQLSLHLKEKFGGLKKFLERFPEIFVYSNDHPFNPHVLLRSMLLPEHQKMIYRGVIPMQVMTQYKKNSSNKKSFNRQQQQMGGSNSGGDLNQSGFGLNTRDFGTGGNSNAAATGFPSSQFEGSSNNSMPLSQFGSTGGLIIDGPALNNNAFSQMGNIGGNNMNNNTSIPRFNKPPGLASSSIGGNNSSRGSQFAMNTPLPPTPNQSGLFSSNNSSFNGGGNVTGRDNFPSFNSMGNSSGMSLSNGVGRFGSSNADHLDNWPSSSDQSSGSFGSRIFSYQQSNNNIMNSNNHHNNNNSNNSGFSNNSNYFSR